MSLSPNRWREVRRIFEQIVEQPSSQWPLLLDELCRDSKDVREEVESLLLHDGPESLSPSLSLAEEPSATESASIEIDRFDIIRTIGRGGYGNVYLAFDRERDHHVALKSLRELDPRAIRGFKKGFRLLKEIRHPNLVKMHDLVSDGQSFYLGMELLDGTDFLTFAARHPNEAIPALGQLAAGLHALHHHGVLHRDVKPSNVWVTETGRVVLLDFGMTREVDVPFASGSGALFGTPHYIAPELLDGGKPSPAGDWYAVGVMLHECLAGAPPFVGTAFEILTQKRDGPVPTPIPNLVDAPEDIVALCAELLARDPGQRPDGPSVIARLGSHEDVISRRPGFLQPELTGRTSHLDRLTASFEHSRREVTVVWIRGASGTGKTTLVQHFLKRLRGSRSDLVALEGRCNVSEFVPYKAVDELVDELARYLSSLSPSEASAVLPRNTELLARVFPVMTQFSVRAAVERDPNQLRNDFDVRRRAFQALRELLDRLAERKRVVLFIDDAQWGDLDSVPLISELMAPPDSPPVLWLMAYRDEDADSSPFLTELLSRPSLTALSGEELEVDPLSQRDAESLATALFRRAGNMPGRTVVQAIAAESGGSPLFVNQLVQHWTKCPAERAEKALTLDEVLVSRVERLPEGPRELLELVVVAQRRLEQSAAFRARSASAPSPDESDRLVAERLLRVSSAGDRDALEVFHDRVRETLLPRIPLERLQALHARLAVSLEEEGGIDPERLMQHFELGGRRDKAAFYAERAAEAAASSLTFDRAAELYRRLLEWGSHPPGRALALRRSLADALSSAGRGYEAANEYLRIAHQSPAESRFQLEQLAAEHCLRSGHVEEGVELLRALCRRAGIRFPEGTWRAVLSTLWKRARVRLRGLPSEKEVQELPLPQSTENQLDLCWTAGFGIGLVDAVLGSDFHSRFYLLATRTGNVRRIAMALAAEAAYGAFVGERGRRRGEEIYERFECFASKIHDPFVRGFGLAMRGTMSWLLGDFRHTGELNRDALAIFEAEGVGVGWERTTAQIHRIGSMSMMGEWHRIAAELPALLEEAASRGDRYAHVGLRLMPYPYVVRLAADDPERARTELSAALSEWTPDGFHIQHCDAMFGLADVALYEARPWEALEILESRREGLRRSRLLYAQLTRVFFHTLRARAAVSALAEDGGRDSRRAMVRAALDRDVRRVGREKARWTRGWSLLLVAGRYSLDGRLDEAAKALASAERELERTDLLAYKAACQWRRGALLQGDHGRKLQNEAAVWMGGRGIRVPERIADMFVPGRWR